MFIGIFSFLKAQSNPNYLWKPIINPIFVLKYIIKLLKWFIIIDLSQELDIWMKTTKWFLIYYNHNQVKNNFAYDLYNESLTIFSGSYSWKKCMALSIQKAFLFFGGHSSIIKCNFRALFIIAEITGDLVKS